MLKNSRAHAFIPQLVLHLSTHASFICKFSDLPASYQSQPFNLSAKVLSRGNIHTKVVFNRERDTFTIIKFDIRQKSTTKPHVHRKSKTRNRKSVPTSR